MSPTRHFNLQFQNRLELFSAPTVKTSALNSLINSLENQEVAKNQLLVAPWGGGKTHFLLTVFNEVCDSEDLALKWTPLFISGRENLFSTFFDFLDVIIDQVARIEGCKSYLEEYNTIKKKNHPPGELKESIDALLRKIASEKGKKLLVFIDDLDLLADFISHDSSSPPLLAGFFSLEDSLVVLGSAAADPAQNKKHHSVFSGIFDCFPLPPFTEEESVSLLQETDRKDQEGVLSNRTKKNHPAILTLFHYTRGNPRLVSIMRRVLEENESAEPYWVLSEMLDILAPYYRSLIQNTPAKERKLLHTLFRIDRWAPPSKLAKNLSWEGKEVSVLLKRLINRGLVQKAQIGPKKSLYGAADPMFCAYYYIHFGNTLKNHPRQTLALFHHLYDFRKWGKIFEREGSEGTDGLYYLEPDLEGAEDARTFKVIKLFEEKKWKDAGKGIQNLLQEPDLERRERQLLLSILGFIFSVKGKHEKAVECYKKCLENNEPLSLILNNMGCDYHFMGLKEEAAKFFLRSLECRENFPPALFNLGATFSQMGKVSNTVEFFLRLEKNFLNTPFAEKLNNRAIQIIFKAYSRHVDELAALEKNEESYAFLSDRMAFISSLSPNIAFSAIIAFLVPLMKPETRNLAEKAFDSIKETLLPKIPAASSLFSVAFQYMESGKNDILLSQNKEFQDAVRLILD